MSASAQGVVAVHGSASMKMRAKVKNCDGGTERNLDELGHYDYSHN